MSLCLVDIFSLANYCLYCTCMLCVLVHVIMRFYESTKKTREDKVKDTLETMGASILVGGISTSLGVLPLALSTSSILHSVFTCFFAMIALGVTHGLVFLPVLLAICGPTRTQHVPELVMESAGDLVLKAVEESDTDESEESDDHTNKKRSHGQASESLPDVSARSMPRYATVLHSQTTFRDESLEVMQWNPDTMAWI